MCFFLLSYGFPFLRLRLRHSNGLYGLGVSQFRTHGTGRFSCSTNISHNLIFCGQRVEKPFFIFIFKILTRESILFKINTSDFA